MHQPAADRYDAAPFRRCGATGLRLPDLSLGLWHNFGDVDRYETGRELVLTAFDRGVTHFDLANNYGPPPGSAERTFGRVLREDLAEHRDELIVSTKAGYLMWPGPYGDGGSRKYLMSSLDQSLRRMGLECVDIFYSHRPDSETPLEETMGALASAVRQGKALYAGISNYPPDQTRAAAALLREMGCPLLIHQAKYSMFERWVEDGLLDALEGEGAGCIAFSPLAQGLLTDRYLGGVPDDSRMAKPHGFLQGEELTPEVLQRIRGLHAIAEARDQSLAQMAIAWLLKDARVTSVLIGASSVAQLEDNLRSRERSDFSSDELAAIEAILASAAAAAAGAVRAR